MPTAWQYPRWRRILMQVTLWLALAATTGIAALVGHARRQATAVALPRQVRAGAVTLGLPSDWEVARGVEDGSAVVLLARETARSDGDESSQPRTLLVRLFPSTLDAASPEEFLHRSGLLHGALRGDGTDDAPQRGPADQDQGFEGSRPCSVAGSAGILVKVYRISGMGEDGPRTAYEQWFACGLLPGGRALVLQLDCAATGEDDASERLMQAIAAGARVAPPIGAPAQPPAGSDERL